MRLQNKKTGEIATLIVEGAYDFVTNFVVEDDARNRLGEYDSLAKLNEEWEDVPEESKAYWFIDAYGNIVQNKITKHNGDEYIDMTNAYERQKQIGNRFESEQAAKRAEERLKAWKRLKDKGFVWQGWEEGAMDNGMCVIGCQIPENNWETDVVKYLDLLFGGEE